MADEENTFSWYQRNSPYVWASIKFVLYMSVFFILLTSNFGQKELVEPFTATIATMTGFFLNLLGMKAHVDGTMVMRGLFGVQIVNGCNGVYLSAGVAAGMLAAPRSWMHRTLGIAAALSIIYVLNIIRAASLLIIGGYSRDWFEFAHIYIGQTVVVVAGWAVLVLWALWTRPATPEPTG